MRSRSSTVQRTTEDEPLSPKLRRRVAGDRPPRGGQQVGRGVRRPRRAGLAQHQQLGDHAREPIDLAQRAVDLLDGGTGRRRRGLLQPQPQPGQRRPQLVRGVGDEVALRVDHPLHARRHLVERARDLLLLQRPLDRHAHRQVALARPPRGERQPPQRPRHRGRQEPARRQPEREHDQADEHEPDRRRAHRAPDGVDALRHAHRAVGLAVAHDRDRGGEDALVERLAVARDLRRDRRAARSRSPRAWSSRRPRRRAPSRRRSRRRGRRSARARAPRAPRSRRAASRSEVPAAVAATTSACPSACVLTSASIREATDRTSGTSIDPIASTST